MSLPAKRPGFTGGYTVVKEAVRELTQRNQEVFVPLVHPPGEAQMDFGHALVKMNGVLRKVAFFVMALPYSDAVFVQGAVGHLLPMNPSRDLPPENPDVRPTADLAKVIEQITLLPEPKPLEQRIRLWADPWWAGSILGLLTVYWVSRKLAGMV